MPDQSAVLTLSSYMRHRSCDGLNPSPRSVFVLEKSQRDRLVLLDTPLAPLLRRYHTSDDVQRYSVLPSTRYLLCLPPGWTAQHCGTHADGNAAWQCIAEHFPALSRHLALAVAERPFTSGHWWELAPESVLPPNPSSRGTSIAPKSTLLASPMAPYQPHRGISRVAHGSSATSIAPPYSAGFNAQVRHAIVQQISSSMSSRCPKQSSSIATSTHMLTLHRHWSCNAISSSKGD